MRLMFSIEGLLHLCMKDEDVKPVLLMYPPNRSTSNPLMFKYIKTNCTFVKYIKDQFIQD